MFAQTAFGLFLIIAARYFAVAGGAYLVCWVWLRARWRRRRLQPATPPAAIRAVEIRYSLYSSAIFALAGAGVYVAWQHGNTRLYSAFGEHGWPYALGTLPILMFLHDTYFYFVHRLMHTRFFFARVHRIHHLSRNPTPWAAFSFHPWEALLEAAILPVLIFAVPIHVGLLLAFLGVMTVLSVVNHLGYELYPDGWDTHPLTRWIISASHHDRHHRRVRCNFGLYFTIWDRWLGTQETPEGRRDVTPPPSPSPR